VNTLIEDLESRGFTDSLADLDKFEEYAKSLGFYCHLAIQPNASLAPGILLSGSISASSPAPPNSTPTSPPFSQRYWQGRR
jgi:hypothetical protein